MSALPLRRCAPAAVALLATCAAFGHAQCELAPLLPLGGSPTFGLGTAVAIHGTNALVGAPDPSVFDATGTVHGFEKVGSNWQDRGLIKPLTPLADDRFGASLATGPDFAVIGAPGRSSPYVEGSVYVFERTGATWNQVAHLQPAQPEEREGFGTSVAIYEDQILVGAPGDQSAQAGRAFLFERDPSSDTWAEVDVLVPAAGQPFDGFGQAVSLGPETIVVGAPNGTPPGGGPAHTGSVHLFLYESGAWTESVVLRPPDGKAGDGFGSSLSLDPESLLGPIGGAGKGRFAVGAPYHRVGGLPHGSLYIYRRFGPGWTIESLPNLAPGLAASALGTSVMIQGDLLLAGDPAAGVNGIAGAGRAHSFAVQGGVWVHTSVLEPSTPKLLGGFSSSLDLQGSLALSGSLDPFGPGASHAFSLGTGDCPSLIADTTTLSLSLGGVQKLALGAGIVNAGRLYLILGSATGTAPGLAVDAGLLPLNPDPYFTFRLLTPHLPPVQGGLGLLNPLGTSTGRVEFPPGSPAGLAGLTLHHAFVVIDHLGSGNSTFTSNAVPVFLIP